MNYARGPQERKSTVLHSRGHCCAIVCSLLLIGVTGGDGDVCRFCEEAMVGTRNESLVIYLNG